MLLLLAGKKPGEKAETIHCKILKVLIVRANCSTGCQLQVIIENGSELDL
jgi:hypothetical protein